MHFWAHLKLAAWTCTHKYACTCTHKHTCTPSSLWIHIYPLTYRNLLDVPVWLSAYVLKHSCLLMYLLMQVYCNLISARIVGLIVHFSSSFCLKMFCGNAWIMVPLCLCILSPLSYNSQYIHIMALVSDWVTALIAEDLLTSSFTWSVWHGWKYIMAH